MNASLILACGGSSARMGFNKLLTDIGGISCIRRSCVAFEDIPDIKEIVIAAPSHLHETYRNELCGISKPTVFVDCGATRQQSVADAVSKATGEYVIVHDGARPLITRQEIQNCIADAENFGSSVLCTKSKDTVRVGDTCPDRNEVYIVRTPQIFKREQWLKAYSTADKEYTDDASLIESIGIKPHLTMGEYINIKLTTVDDIATARAILAKGDSQVKIGHGYDVHRLVENRDLIIGGVKISYDKGLLGHSDADVLTHAVMDALLGALALGDIGKLFPDSDPKYKGADSIKLLEYVTELINSKGWCVSNIDCTVLAQAPKLAVHISAMRSNLATAMNTDIERISVKATTEEGLGFTGSGEGIAAHAACLLKRI